jgi:hypothetical protein
MFKRIAVVLGTVMIATAAAHPWAAIASGSFDKKACTVNGKKLYGRIQEVSSGADVTVQVVSSLGDLKVQKVSSFADSCGKWQMVDSLGDTKVKFVSSGADVKIQYVSSFPGAN